MTTILTLASSINDQKAPAGLLGNGTAWAVDHYEALSKSTFGLEMIKIW